MVNFETQVYQREGNSIIGAEVIVYSDTGERIGNIKITDESDYNDLVDRINGIANECVGYDTGSSLAGETIETILANLSEATTINATKLNGIQSDQYTKVGHTHTKNEISNLYNYNISLSDYNSKIGSEVTVTVKVTKQNGSPVPNQQLILTKDGATWKSGQGVSTNSNGIYKTKFTPTDGGIVTFGVENQKVQLNVDGWETISTNINGATLKVNRALKLARLYGQKTVTFSNTTAIYIGDIPEGYRPTNAVRQLAHSSLDSPLIFIEIRKKESNFPVYLKTSRQGQSARSPDWDVLWSFD